MGRRNVLGNQIESSKSMWIVLLGLIVSILQLSVAQFMDDAWFGVLLGSGCILLGSVLVHWITGEQEEIFSYLLVPCVLSGVVGLLAPRITTTVLPEAHIAFYGCLLAWLIPVLYACIFTWAEGTPALPQFTVFYKKAAVFFYLVYFCLVLYRTVWLNIGLMPEGSVQWIPFATFAAYVDGMIEKNVSVQQLWKFLADRVVLFLPYGFFIAMVGRGLHSLARLGLVLLLPLSIEVLQGVCLRGACDADDALFSFLGGLIGMLCFLIFNGLFQRTTGKNFNGSEIERDYYGRKL